MVAAPPSAFVGRAAELGRLTAAVDEAGRGGAPAVVIEGESGAGKTRLLKEFAAVATERGATVLLGRCVDCGEAGPPYWPFIEALRGLPDDDPSPEAGRGGADGGGPEHRAEAAREDGGGTGSQAGAGGGDRAGFFERVLDRLEGAGRRSPVVLLLDDLHWADRSTRDLLGFLLANLAGGPGPLVVVTVRSEALLPGHPLVPLLAELRRSRRAEFLTLDRLTKGDVAAQLASILGQAPDPELLDEIWRRSEGNPFFVEELVAARSPWPLTPPPSGGLPPSSGGHERTFELSSTLSSILSARLGALSPAARAAAGAVATAVGPVPHRILAEVSGLTEPALLAGLQECVDHHVLVADARAGTYAFRHSLLQEAAYAALLPGDATRLHAAFGRALAAILPTAGPTTGSPTTGSPTTGSPTAQGPAIGGPAVRDLASVAWHLYAAGDAERALPAALAAAVAAEAACGYAEAQVQYERALELAQPADRVGLAERAAEAANLAGDPARAVVLLEVALGGERADDASRLHLALGRARWAAGDSEGALAAYDEAIRQLGDPRTGEGVRAVAAAAEARMLAGRYGESRRLAEEALALARTLGLPLEEAEILGTLGVDLAFLGDAGPAVAALDEAVAVAEKAGRPRPLARALLNRAEVLSGPLNRLGEAADVAAAGLARLRHLGLDRSYAAALAATLANTLFRLGRWRDADPVINAALADRPTGAAAVELLLARARLSVGRGDFAAAHGDLERVDHRWTQAVAPRYRAPLLTLSAGLALWEGRIDDAREAVARALDLVAGSDDVWLVAPILWHGLRAEGDRVAQARAFGDRTSARAAAEDAAGLVQRAAALQQGAAPAVRPVVAAYEALCRAEALRAAPAAEPTRTTAHTDPMTAAAEPTPAAANDDPRTAGAEPTRAARDADAWAAAAEQWAGLGQPYPSAYARFREAEAVLADKARSARAANALRAAHEVAVRLGAEPFRREVEALARRARVALPRLDPEQSGGPAATDERAAGNDTAGAGGSSAIGGAETRSPGGGAVRAAPGPLDQLTPRELDVLLLLAEGRTNREVAAALFISEKTASVHVSHILAKLGVRSRVQAVAVAHRVGVTGPS